MSASCRLCGTETAPVARQRLLGKYDVEYGQCPRCDLLQTETPYWLGEAYAAAISRLDTGAVQRNQVTSRLTAVIARLLDVHSSCLDYGGGHGVFVRMMRDLGLDFRWFDKYAENLYAAGFDATPDEHHTLVTAFEVLEHFDDVKGELARLFAPKPDHVLVGTLLHHGHHDGWWYYLLESGQHVAFFSAKTLAFVAAEFGYDVIVGPEYSLFSAKPVATVRRAIVKRLLARPSLAGLVPRPVVQRPSLVQPDHDRLRKSVT